jgi:preprotein translocase subunit YajC
MLKQGDKVRLKTTVSAYGKLVWPSGCIGKVTAVGVEIVEVELSAPHGTALVFTDEIEKVVS